MVVDGEPHPRTGPNGDLFQAGDVLEIEGDEEVRVRYGSAGNVLVTLNGEVLGAPGAPGAVIDVTYRPDGPSAA